MSLLLSLEDWITLTTVLMLVFSPLYWGMMQIEKQLSAMIATVQACPYCSRDFETERKERKVRK
jgi:hypothetical protein